MIKKDGEFEEQIESIYVYMYMSDSDRSHSDGDL